MAVALPAPHPPAAAGRLLPLLAAAGFASMAAMRIADAMLPALAREFGSAPDEAAAVIWSFALAYGAVLVVYGPLGDRLGKPLVINFGALLCALGALAAALAPTLPALTAARVVMGAGAGGIIPLALAWIGDQVPMAERQAVLARYAGVTVMGLMAGAWAGGLFAQTLGWRWAFVTLAALLAGVAVVLAVANARQRRGRAKHALPDAGAAPSRLPFHRQVAAVFAEPWGRGVLLFVFVEGALVFGTLALVPSVLHARFGVPLGDAGAAVAVFGVGGLAYSRLAAWWLRRGDSAAAGGLLLLAGFGLLAAMPHWAWAVPACGVAGLGFYALHNVLQMQGTQLATQARGTGMALFAGSLFFGQSLGVAAGAWAFAHLPPALCFALAGLGMSALGLTLARQLRRRRAAAAAASA
ncbi:MAG: MFS transporter [Rubrivivax sp.]|nr:MFS transporter [Rubrivivax sp.]